MYEKAEVVHLLDLCIFSYQLHNQTLIWPFDPYYEQWETALKDKINPSKMGRRDKMMKTVHASAKQGEYDRYFPGSANSPGGSLPLSEFHGPAAIYSLSNGLWISNKDLDPVISDYNLINPWRPSVVRANAEKENWIIYNTNPDITDRIDLPVKIAIYDPEHGGALALVQAPPHPPVLPNVVPPRVRLNQIPGPPLARPAALPAGTDWLYCFEGGGGGIVRKRKAHAWSIMGLVLTKFDTTGPTPQLPVALGGGQIHPYDVYIVFRGSRSGDPRIPTTLATDKGNPDWVTDMDFGAGGGSMTSVPEISGEGEVAAGFAASVSTMLPTIMRCLQDIQARQTVLQHGVPHPPRTIYVTGHSLGAALAVHFTSAVLLGTTYGHDAAGTSMDATIRKWPWKSIQLVPFALPVVGDKTFHDAFNISLSSRNFELRGDPVTQRRRRYQVGHTYTLVPETTSTNLLKTASYGGDRHEPYNMRKFLIKTLRKKGFSAVNLNQLSQLEPWLLCQNFRYVLTALRKIPLPGQGANTAKPVDTILGPTFNERLLLYLDAMYETVENDKKPAVDVLKQVVTQIAVVAPPANIWGNPFNVTKNLVQHNNLTLSDVFDLCKVIYGDDFSHFVGLCLFLSVANRLNDGVVAQSQNTPPFNRCRLK